MTPYLDQLRSATEATVVDWPTGFWWFGRHSARLAPSVSRALPPEPAREYLVQSLEAQLYSEFYCRGGAAPERPLSPVVAASADVAAFVRELSDANHGHGRWDDGWALSSWDGDTAVVTRDGVRLWVADDELCHLTAGRPGIGEQVAVRHPKELVGISPGFYLATGDEGGPGSEGGPMIRLYWHLSPAGALDFMSRATAGLNDRAVPFGVKVAKDLLSFERCDPVVVYVRKQDFAAVADVLTRIHSHVYEQLRPEVPALTKRLAAGVGLAEDPGGGQSFGYQRCGLVAEALVVAHEQGARKVGDRLAVVVDHLARHGVSVDAPFLSAGSSDTYDILAPAVPRRRGAPTREHSAEDFVSLAARIGRRLVDDAIWCDNRCSWVDTRYVHERRVGPTRVTGFGPLGADVYAGTAGVALFLADLTAATAEGGARATAVAAMRTALSRAAHHGGVGLYEGWPGTALAAVRAGDALGCEELLAGAGSLVHDRLPALGVPAETDLLVGAAGSVVALLSLGARLGDDSLVSAAVRLGDHLVATASPSPRGCSWPSLGGSTPLGLTGLSHGAAGVGLALVELWAATGDGRYATTARQAFDYERSWFDADRGNWRDLRDAAPARMAAAPGAERFAALWCHGAPGIAISRLRAYQVLGDECWRAEAEVALATTRRAVEADVECGVLNYSLCHGVAGNADVLLHGAQVLDPDRPEPDALVRRVAEHGLEIYDRVGRTWPCGVGGGESPSLLLGLAGIGHFYLRAADPRIPTVLAGVQHHPVPPQRPVMQT